VSIVSKFLLQVSNAARRAAMRGQTRNYEAARPSRIAAGFDASGTQSASELLRWQLRGLVNHSRQQAQNNDYLKAYFGMVRRHIVGPQGIRLQARARDQKGNLDKADNLLLETAWAEWGRMGSPTVCGQHSWLSLQALAAETVARDGNILFRKHRGLRHGKFGFRLEPLEIDHLDIERNVAQPNGTQIIMGIELDASQRPVAYHLLRNHPGELLRSGLSREVVRVPAEDVIMLFRAERPGQKAGAPWAYTALRRLNMLRGYEEAAITAARVGAAKMGFFQKTDDKEDLRPEDLDQVETTETGHLISEAEPGMFETLPVGYEYREHNPAYPSGEIEPFMKVVLRGAAAGLGVSYAALANDLSQANFSSMRAGQSEERDEWRTLQTWMAEGLHDKVYRDWLPSAIVAGALPLPMSRLDKFTEVRWRPRGWGYVNPSDEANANQREMAAMLRAPQEIVAERGADLEEIFEMMAEAKATAKEYGLDFNPMPPGHENPAAAAPADPPAP
jgi:lambda family phage portal protein